MATTEVEAYLSIPMPSIEPFETPDEKGKSRIVLYAIIDELRELSTKLEFHLGNSMVMPEIHLLDDEARQTTVKRRIITRKHLKRCEILRVSASVPLSFYDDILSSSDDIDRDVAARFLTRVEFGKQISDLFVMANVASVGAIELEDSTILQDGQTLEYAEVPRMDGWSLQRAANAAVKMGWPRLDAIDIQTVWRWHTKHRQMLEAFDGTAMGRALCAFSRLFEHKTADEPMQLVWALVGLEAIYVSGKAELLQQVREKAQVLLGPQAAFKKKITQMYDFRSRFVHGDLDFPGLCMVGDARERFMKYEDELLEAIAIAVALLAGTIQEIIRRDWSGLRFEYTVGDSV